MASDSNQAGLDPTGADPAGDSTAGTDATRGPQLCTLVLADSPDSWRAGGFEVDEAGVCLLGSVAIHLDDGDGGFRSWDFDGINGQIRQIDGLEVIGGPTPTRPTEDGRPHAAPGEQAGKHPNGITSIDHIVIRSGNCERTIAALEAAGFPRRGGRSTTSYGFPTAQSFFWAGDVILELVGPDEGEPTTDEPTSIFGLALVSPDMAETAHFLGELIGEPKPAVQKGRRIAGLKGRSIGIGMPIAVMTPHPSG